MTNSTVNSSEILSAAPFQARNSTEIHSAVCTPKYEWTGRLYAPIIRKQFSISRLQIAQNSRHKDQNTGT